MSGNAKQMTPVSRTAKAMKLAPEPLKTITANATITPAEFKVDLGQFQSALNTVSGELNLIKNNQESLLTILQQVEMDWQSPAGTAYAAFYPDFSNALQALVALLESILARMHTTYNNYQHTEEINTEILADNNQINAQVNQEKATVNADNSRISAEEAQIKAEIAANHGYGNTKINSQIAEVNSRINQEKSYIEEMTKKIDDELQAEKNLANSISSNG